MKWPALTWVRAHPVLAGAPTLTWVRAHPVLAGALACALVGTANAEYTLATGTHVNEYVALAVPGALDLYVIQALRVHRDVAAAVLVMVAANVASHLLTAGLYPSGYWWDFGITAGVGALAPGIVWRVHSLERTRNRQEILWELPAGAVKSPGVIPIGPEVIGTAGPVPAWVPGYHLDGCDGVHLKEGPVACAHRASALEAEYASAPVPDSVPEEWSAAEYGDPDAPIPYLRAVPDPEPDSEPGYTVHSDTCPEECECPSALEYSASAVHLNVGDEEYIETARKYVAGTDKPSVRGMKDYAKVGQARAERLLAYLGVRP